MQYTDGHVESNLLYCAIIVGEVTIDRFALFVQKFKREIIITYLIRLLQENMGEF